jgi:hypothetical protein
MVAVVGHPTLVSIVGSRKTVTITYTPGFDVMWVTPVLMSAR